MHATTWRFTTSLHLHFLLLRISREGRVETGALSCALGMCTALHIGVAFQIPGPTSELLKDPPKRSHFPLLPFKFVGQPLTSPNRYHPLRQHMMLNTRLWLFPSNVLGKVLFTLIKLWVRQIRIGPEYGIFPGHSQTGQIVTALQGWAGEGASDPFSGLQCLMMILTVTVASRLFVF